MTAAKSPISGQQQQQQIVRKPLQPKNILTAPPISSNHKPKPVWNEFISFLDSNKENQCHPKPIVIVESIDPSLGEELSAIRQKLERIKLEKEKTEKILKERDSVFDKKMKELQNRGEIQKMLEIEVDRLFRLKELQISCMRISPIRSLREKEGGGRTTMKKKSEEQSEDSRNAGNSCASIDERSPPPTPISEIIHIHK